MMPNNDNHWPHGSNHQRFAELLGRTSLAAYWDLDAGECDIERLKRDMGAWSHGERHHGAVSGRHMDRPEHTRV